MKLLKYIFCLLLFWTGAQAQTVPGSPILTPGSVSPASGGGTVGPGTINTLAKFATTTTVGDSLLTDDGTTLTYSGTGGIAAGGTASGILTLNGLTSGKLILTLADATAQTLTVSAAAQTVGAATLTIPDLAGVNSTVATQAYARATNLGTFASPNTAAGAITWNSAVYNIYTSAGSTRTYTLPAASTYSGKAFILNVAVGTGHVNVQPASGAALVLAGVLLTADHYVQAATSAPGNYICFVSDGTNWTSLGSSGTWADAASP